MRFFDFQVDNASGETIIESILPGIDWVGGSAVNSTWTTQITDDSIRFYNNSLSNGVDEEFLAASSAIDCWGIGTAVFNTDIGTSYEVSVLQPRKCVPVPGAALLGVLGLSTAGWMTRRKTQG